MLQMDCFLCATKFYSHERLKVHLQREHLVQQNVDVLALLQLKTESEKVSMYQQLEKRMKVKDYEDESRAVQNTLENQNNVEALEPKIMFWKGKEKSPKIAVNKNGLKFFSNDKIKETTEDLIDMFDQIYDENVASPFDKLNESLECNFDRLLDDDPIDMKQKSSSIIAKPKPILNHNEAEANWQIKDVEMNKITELQSQLENYHKITQKLEFLNSQLVREKDEIKVELEKVLEEKNILGKENEVMQQKNIELESRNENWTVIQNELLAKNNSLTEKVEDLETKLKIQNDKQLKDEKIFISMSSEIDWLKEEKVSMELKIAEVCESRDRMETRCEKLQENLKSTNASRGTLDSSVSQLITENNEIKDKMVFINMTHEKEIEVFKREKLELKAAVVEKEQTLFELLRETNAKASFENDLKEQVAKNEELRTSIDKLFAMVDKLNHDLAAAEIKYTDLEQSTQENRLTVTKEALKAQRERYETSHRKIVNSQAEKYKAKIQEFAVLTEEHIEKNNEEVKKIIEEKRHLAGKCEYYKKRVADVVGKMKENDRLNNQQIEILYRKYNRSREEILRIQKKYDEAETLIHGLTEEKWSLERDLESKFREGNFDILKRELAHVKNENRCLSNRLNYADMKLREFNKF